MQSSKAVPDITNISAHINKELPTLLKFIDKRVSNSLKESLHQQIASFRSLLFHANPDQSLTGGQANKILSLPNPTHSLIKFISLFTRFAETYSLTFTTTYPYTHLSNLQKFTDTFLIKIEEIINERDRIKSLLNDIDAAKHPSSDLSDNVKEKGRKRLEEIAQTSDKNLLKDKTDFSDLKLKEINRIESRTEDIKLVWHDCIQRLLKSKILQYSAEQIKRKFIDQKQALTEFVEAIKIASECTSLNSLIAFKQRFYAWHEVTFHKEINQSRAIFSLFDNIDGFILQKGINKQLTKKLSDLFELHVAFIPNGIHSHETISNISKATKAFDELEKQYPAIKLSILKKQSSTALANQELGNKEQKTNPPKQLGHRRRASSVAGREPPNILSQHDTTNTCLQRMTTFSKLTTHYRTKYPSTLAIIEQSSEPPTDTTEEKLTY